MKSLTTKFILFIIVPVMIIVSVLSVSAYMMARHLMIEQLKLSGLNFLNASSGKISGRIVQIKSVLHLLSTAEKLADLDDAHQRRLFIELKEQLGGSVTSVFMGFDDGRFVRAKKTPLPDDFDPRQRPWYRNALALPPAVYDGVTTPYTDASTGRPTITVFSKVVDADGNLVGVLGVDVDIALAAGTMSVDDPFLGKAAFILVNQEATILIHPDAKRVGTAIDATGERLMRQIARDIRDPGIVHRQYVGSRSTGRWYIGFQRTRDAQVILVISTPADHLLQPLYRLTYQMTALGGAIFVVLLVLLIVVARRIAKPIVDLNLSASRVTEEGVYSDPIQVKSADEIGQLTRAFNEMMAGLQQRDFIRDTFGRYVTKEVVQELLDTSDGLKLGGEMREVTIMFSDLRGFTPLAEQLPPEQTIAVLNNYLSRMAAVIETYEGTINEFIGDAILTIFGAPVKHGDSPARAVSCALAMQLEMASVNQENRKNGLPPLSMGIGINTGEVIVGNIGSEKRAKYGVVGHHINLASRVEGATAGGQILVTPSTYQRIKEAAVIRAVLPMHFKGVEESIDLYDIAGIRGPHDLMLPESKTALPHLERSISVMAVRMENKRQVHQPFDAALTHFAFPMAKVTASIRLDPSQELRVDLPGGRNEKGLHLYARVTDTANDGKDFTHTLQISYLSPDAAQFFDRLMKS